VWSGTVCTSFLASIYSCSSRWDENLVEDGSAGTVHVS